MMKIALILQLAVLMNFSVYSQENALTFTHNGYIFKTDVESILAYFQIGEDSIEVYRNEIAKVCRINEPFPSDSAVKINNVEVYFIDIIRLFNEDQSMVKIVRASDGELVKYKVKIIEEKTSDLGIGGSSKKILVIKDQKKRVEIVKEVISMNLSC